MAEEQRCQEGYRLCANNCGFLGSPATMDLCSKCYRDLRHKEERASSAKIAVGKSLLSSASSSSAAAAPPPDQLTLSPATSEILPPAAALAAAETEAEADERRQRPGRCTACRKRVGLVGFPCRCGATYCGAHRYPERHGCTFDFKAAGREAIARANPVVKADKLGGRRI